MLEVMEAAAPGCASAEEEVATEAAVELSASGATPVPGGRMSSSPGVSRSMLSSSLMFRICSNSSTLIPFCSRNILSCCDSPGRTLGPRGRMSPVKASRHV